VTGHLSHASQAMGEDMRFDKAMAGSQDLQTEDVGVI